MNNKIELFFQKNSISNFTIIILCFFYTFLLSYFNYGQGFDFTDLTLNYHFSLKVLNGEIPFKDFHTSVMPLAYYIEAFFHKIFGKSIEVNLFLGLLNKFFVVYIVYGIFNFFYEKKLSLLITFFVTSLFMSGGQSIFSFSSLAFTLSLASIYFVLITYRNNKYILIIAGIFTALAFLTKQNYGIVLIIAYSMSSILFLFKDISQYKQTIFSFLLFIGGVIIVLIPFGIYFFNLGLMPEVIYILTTGGERKGLSDLSLMQLFQTFFYLGTKYILGYIIGSVLIFVTLYTRNKKLFLFLWSFFILYLTTLQICTHFFDCPLILRLPMEVLFFDAIKVLLVTTLFYSIFIAKSLDKSLIYLMLALSAIIFTNELSWPGRGYKLFLASSIFLMIIPVILNSYKLNHLFSYQKDIFTKTIIIYLVIFTFLELIYPTANHYREFKVDSKYTQKPYLIDYPMSSQHKKAIIDIKSNFNNLCSSKYAFIFPWSPILYELIGAKNPTRFDLPYHDWLTEKEGLEAISDLKKNPPCLLIIENSSLSEKGRYTPFPAKGMRKLEKFFKNEFLENYILVNTVNTYGKTHMIFHKK